MPTIAQKQQLELIKRTVFPHRKSTELQAECTRLESSLYAFVQAAWGAIEGGTRFIGGWHLEALCQHLEAATRGDIKRLIISVPPRTSKTTITSIMWPAWIWTTKPHIKYLYASYSQKISWEHSRVCKMLIESPWYQEKWGNAFQLSKDQSTKGHFTNSKMGGRVATSVGGGTTALGGDILVLDDPNEAGESDVTREGTNDWVSRVWSSRLNPGGLGINVLVQQRTHSMDTSGYWLERYDGEELTKLILPMEYESSRKARTIILPSTNGKVWEDPRTEEGQLLCPEYLSDKDIARKKIELGSYNYAGQYQQRPAPEAGGLIEKIWFQHYKEEKPPKLDFVIQSWDTAFTATETSAYSACTTWGIFKKDGISNLLLLSCWRGKVSFPDLLKRAARLYANWTDIGDAPKAKSVNTIPDTLLIEAKASGHSLAAEFIAKGIPAQRFNPDKYGDKIQRVHKIIPYVETGLVWVAAKAPNFLTLRSDHELLVENCAIFPNAESRDLVDSMTQAFLYVIKEKGLLKHRMDLGFSHDAIPDKYNPGFQETTKKENKNIFS